LRVKLQQINSLPICTAFVALSLDINADGEQYQVQINASALRDWLVSEVLDTQDEQSPKWILANALHNWLSMGRDEIKVPTQLPAWLQTSLTRYIDTFPTDQTQHSLRCPKCQTEAFAYCMAREFYIKARGSEWYRDDYFCECGHLFHSRTGGYHMMLAPKMKAKSVD
jgi:hypothetical protein